MDGVVFDIKEFAVFDGPGVRTTVFMKGCPLRCQWCHNPEGLSAHPQLMVSTGACRKCGACLMHCPLPDKTPGLSMIPARCDACGQCVPYCPEGLRKIAGKTWTDDELAAHLKKGEKLFSETGGGVTFSGGEPLLQWPFVKAVIAKLPGIHTAVQTSGFTSDDVVGEVMETFDLIMLDVKQVDPELHRRFCGQDNACILRHARMLAEGETPYVLRVPLIPGVNDNEAHLSGVAALCKGAKALVKVELLPYHKTAGAKYAMVGASYTPEFDTEAEVCASLAPFVRAGVPATVL